MPVDFVSGTDYDENKKLRRTTPTILRMIDAKTGDYLGKCLFSNMFPIPYNDLIPWDMNKFKKDEISVTEKKLEYLRLQMDRVLKAAYELFVRKFLEIEVCLSLIEETIE